MQERRKFRRSASKETASLESKEGPKQESRLMDVSSSGMRIISDVNIKTGSHLSGKFKIIPNSGHFYVSGEVVWVQPAKDPSQGYEAGIKFNKVSTIPIHTS